MAAASIPAWLVGGTVFLTVPVSPISRHVFKSRRTSAPNNGVNAMLRMVGDCIAVELDTKPIEKRVGSILVAQTATSTDSNIETGIVRYIGPGLFWNELARIHFESDVGVTEWNFGCDPVSRQVNIGERVSFIKATGQDIYDPADEKTYRQLCVRDIQCIHLPNEPRRPENTRPTKRVLPKSKRRGFSGLK